MKKNGNDSPAQLQSLTEESSRLCESMQIAVQSLTETGTPAGDQLIDDLSRFHDNFAKLYSDVYEVDFESAALPEQRSLTQIDAGLAARRTCRQADTLIDQICSLRHVDDDTFAPLAKCKQEARAIRSHAVIAPETPLSADIEAVAKGDHELCMLARMVFDADRLNDDQWGDAQDQLTESYGRELATAVVRGKITHEEA